MTYRRMKECGMSDDSVSEGLHHACKALRDQWSLDNAKRNALESEGGVKRRQKAREQLRLIQDNTRERRDVQSCDDIPLYWVPYVHFGN